MIKKILFKHYIRKHYAKLSALRERDYVAFISIYDFQLMMITTVENYSHFTSIILKRHPKTKFYFYPDNNVVFVK